MKRLLFLWLALLLAANCVAADTLSGTVITQADKPLRLIRGLEIWQAGAGVVLHKGDILETGLAMAQIEYGPNLILALGQHSRLYLAEVDGKMELYLLDGWLKLQSSKPDSNLMLKSALLASSAANSLLFHVEMDRSELFPEQGTPLAMAMERGEKSAEPFKVAQEQHVIHMAGQPLKVLPRPGKDLLAAMPKPFRDALPPLLAKLGGKPQEPVREYELQFAHIEGWLKMDAPALKKEWVKRFKPMLKNPAFHKSLEAGMGQAPEWQTLLNPPKKAHASTPAGGTIY
jgi:hypothetical protein